MVASKNVEASSAAEVDSSKCQKNSTTAGQKHTIPQRIQDIRAARVGTAFTISPRLRTLAGALSPLHMSCSAAVVNQYVVKSGEIERTAACRISD